MENQSVRTLEEGLVDGYTITRDRKIDLGREYLNQNFPNPFNYSMAGQKVRT